MEPIEEEKIKLEITRLQLEIGKLNSEHGKKQKSPHWLFPYIQPLVPTFFTLCSLVITAIIISKSNVFEINNKLLATQKESLTIQKENLTLEIGGFKKIRDSLQGINDSLVNSNNMIVVRNSMLADTRNILEYGIEYEDSLSKSKMGTLPESKKQIAKLALENMVLKNHIKKIWSYSGALAIDFGVAEKHLINVIRPGADLSQYSRVINEGRNGLNAAIDEAMKVR